MNTIGIGIYSKEEGEGITAHALQFAFNTLMAKVLDEQGTIIAINIEQISKEYLFYLTVTYKKA